MIGEVDTTESSLIAGWLPSDSADTHTVTLYISDIKIRSHRAEKEKPGDLLKRVFSFPIGKQLRKNLPKAAPIRVVLHGEEETDLPFAPGTQETFPGEAEDGGVKLRKMLAGKWHVDHWGNMHVTFGKDPGLITRCVSIYKEARQLFNTALNRELYVTGGNLLGLIREGKFLDHDDDIDASVILNAKDEDDAVRQFLDLIRDLVPHAAASGLKVKITSPLHFYLIRPGFPYLDIFVGWFTPEGYWCRPSGYGGMLGVSAFEYVEREYAGEKLAIPAHYEKELILTYGEGWMRKDDYYSKNRPHEPLKKVNRVKHAYAKETEELNAELVQLFGKQG